MIEVYQIGDAVDLRVRALDNSTPVNASAYSATITIIVGAQDARSLNFSKKLNASALMQGW